MIFYNNYIDHFSIKYFIFDKDTFSKSKINIPGPYEIELSGHSTEAKSKTLTDC